MCRAHTACTPARGDFFRSDRIGILTYNEDGDEAEEKSNFFAPIKTLSPALFGGAHPLLQCQRYRTIPLYTVNIRCVYTLVGDGDGV